MSSYQFTDWQQTPGVNPSVDSRALNYLRYRFPNVWDNSKWIIPSATGIGSTMLGLKAGSRFGLPGAAIGGITAGGLGVLGSLLTNVPANYDALQAYSQGDNYNMRKNLGHHGIGALPVAVSPLGRLVKRIPGIRKLYNKLPGNKAIYNNKVSRFAASSVPFIGGTAVLSGLDPVDRRPQGALSYTDLMGNLGDLRFNYHKQKAQHPSYTRYLMSNPDRYKYVEPERLLRYPEGNYSRNMLREFTRNAEHNLANTTINTQNIGDPVLRRFIDYQNSKINRRLNS